MTNTKRITLHYGDKTGHATIASNMTADQIYDALYNAVGYFIGPYDIAVVDAAHDEKVYLSYTTLKEGRAYRAKKATSQAQGEGSGSRTSQRIAENIAKILEHWKLQHVGQIFEGHWDIAPKMQPHEWSRGFSQELRIFAKQTQGRHSEAMRLLVGENENRQENEEDAVVEFTTVDIKNAMSEKTRRVAIGAWIEVEEHGERMATKVFAGGWSEGLDSVQTAETTAEETTAEETTAEETTAEETSVAQAAVMTLAMLPSRQPDA